MGWCFQSWWKQCVDLVYLRVQWPFDFLLPWYCPHLPTPIITDRRQNLFSWMKSQSVGKIWRTVNQWTTNFFSVNLYFQKVLDSAFYDHKESNLWTILQIERSVICLNLNTVEPPCATTSCKRPPPITDPRPPIQNTKIFPVKAYSWNLSVTTASCRRSRPPFRAWRVMNFHCL